MAKVSRRPQKGEVVTLGGTFVRNPTNEELEAERRMRNALRVGDPITVFGLPGEITSVAQDRFTVTLK